MLTLSNALKTGRLREFVAQEVARGVPSPNARALDKAIKALATQPLSEDQMHSTSCDCSTEK
jgi:hypothetical protein